jgi:hypothetical protein
MLFLRDISVDLRLIILNSVGVPNMPMLMLLRVLFTRAELAEIMDPDKTNPELHKLIRCTNRSDWYDCVSIDYSAATRHLLITGTPLSPNFPPHHYCARCYVRIWYADPDEDFMVPVKDLRGLLNEQELVAHGLVKCDDCGKFEFDNDLSRLDVLKDNVTPSRYVQLCNQCTTNTNAVLCTLCGYHTLDAVIAEMHRDADYGSGNDWRPLGVTTHAPGRCCGPVTRCDRCGIVVDPHKAWQDNGWSGLTVWCSIECATEHVRAGTTMSEAQVASALDQTGVTKYTSDARPGRVMPFGCELAGEPYRSTAEMDEYTLVLSENPGTQMCTACHTRFVIQWFGQPRVGKRDEFSPNCLSCRGYPTTQRAWALARSLFTPIGSRVPLPFQAQTQTTLPFKELVLSRERAADDERRENLSADPFEHVVSNPSAKIESGPS